MSDTPDAISDDDLLAAADALHDDDPQRALATLRGLRVEALSPAVLDRLAFLLAHVSGEKFGLWPEALRGLRAIVERQGDDATPYVLRHAAIVARAADDSAQARAWTLALAERTGGAPDEALALVALGVVGFGAAAMAAADAGRAALRAVAPLARVAPSGLDAGFGAVLNNLASGLLERPLADFADAGLRDALTQASMHSLLFWQRGGTWLNAERAHYLNAMRANVLGDAAGAAAHARAGLALLDRHADEPEDVDRAFLELELSVALRLLGESGHAAALARAEALAQGFAEPGLDAWFADRRARGEAVVAHHAGR